MMKKKLTTAKLENINGNLFILIPMLGFLLFSAIPIGYSLVISLTNYNGINYDSLTFVGFSNYVTILKDPAFWKSMLVTVIATLGVPLGIILGLVIAMLINAVAKGNTIYKIAMFIPFVVSSVAVAMIWGWMFNSNFGIINVWIYKIFGRQGPFWLEDPNIVLLVYILQGAWSSLGFNIILFSAALGSIPQESYEVAKIDGANPFQTFTKITIPLISPTTFYLFTFGLIGSLQDFSRFMLMTQKGPDNMTFTAVYYLYDHAFQNALTGLGYASAVGWVICIFVGIVTLINFVVTQRRVHYG